MNLDSAAVTQLFSMLLQALVVGLVGLVVYIFADMKKESREQAKELTAAVNSLNLKFMEVLAIMRDYGARLESLENGERK